MTLDDFVIQTTGRAVTYDNVQANYGQCEQLVQVYQREVQNTPVFVTPYAKNYWLLFKGSPLEAYYDQIQPGQSMEVGDIVVLGASSSINSPVAGHIDICLIPKAGGYTGFDSNWAGVTDQNHKTSGYGYPAAHQVQHTLKDVLGYLRLKEDNVSMPNSGDITNAKRFSTGVSTYTPSAAEIASFQTATGWHDLLYDTISGGDVQVKLASQKGVTRDSVITYIEANLK